MKKIFISILLIIGLAACENQPWDFPDYNLQTVYFPAQTPLRTLSMGEDRIDNTLDKEGKFDIGVNIGGLFKNKQDWTVDYVEDTTLIRNAFIYAKPQTYSSAEKLYALPQDYYTLSPTGTVTIPSGVYNGMIRVQLNDKFFDDPLSLTGRYVIALRLTNTSADSILEGKTTKEGADPRIVGDWNPNQSPKNWVLFGINYYNPYHGNWLHRGTDKTKSVKTGNDTTIVFRNKYVERDILIKTTTTGRAQVLCNGFGFKTGSNYTMVLDFANDKGTPGAITISKSPTSTITVTGTGQYNDIATSKEKWSLLTWQSMYLQYTYNDGTNNHLINDTLVFRDRGMKYNINSVVIKP